MAEAESKTATTPVPIFRAGLGRNVPPGNIRVGPGTEIPRVLRDFGVDPAPVLLEFGVPVDLFDDPDNTIPYDVFCRLAFQCTQLIGRDDLGLLVCEDVGPSNLGLVGFLLKQAPSVRVALNDLVRYLHHHDRGAVPFMRIKGGVVALGYSIYEPNVSATAQFYDGAIAIARNIMLALCGPQWRPIEVALLRHRPSAAGRYEAFFGAPVRFDAEESAIFFHEQWLETPIAHNDPALRRMLQEQIDLLEQEAAGMVAEKVRRLIRTSLLTSAVSLEEVSRLLGMNQRTLARRLEAESTSFKEITDEVHFSVARQFLAHTDMTITQVSLALNYSEASAFTRAFRRWSGKSPGAWRALHCRNGMRHTTSA